MKKLTLFFIILALFACEFETGKPGDVYIIIYLDTAFHAEQITPAFYIIVGNGPEGEYAEVMVGIMEKALYALAPGRWGFTVMAYDSNKELIGKGTKSAVIIPDTMSTIEIIVTPLPELTPFPTGVPTIVPTHIPTPVPTVVPTGIPTPVPTVVPTDIPTQVPTDEPTPDPTPVSTSIPTPVPTTIPTDIPTQNPTDVPTPIPTQTPAPTATHAPTPVPVHYGIIYYVCDTDCTCTQYIEGYNKVKYALNEITERFEVELDLHDLGQVWDAPPSDATGTVLADLRSDFSMYGGGNRYVVGYTPVMDNNGVAYLRSNYCVIAWRPSSILSFDHEETKLTAHELTHNWGVDAEGHVDSLVPSPEVCVMNYYHLAFMDPNNIKWCDGCAAIVENTMNFWPAR